MQQHVLENDDAMKIQIVRKIKECTAREDLHIVKHSTGKTEQGCMVHCEEGRIHTFTRVGAGIAITAEAVATFAAIRISAGVVHALGVRVTAIHLITAEY